MTKSKTIKCRLCKSKNTTFLFFAPNTHGRHVLNKKARYPLYRCQKCQGVFLAGIKINSKYYRDSYQDNYYVDSHEPTLVEKLWNLISKLLVKQKVKFLVNSLGNRPNDKKIKVLDVGCGNGDFLSQLPTSKFDKYGIEINPDGVKRCREKGIKVFGKPIEKLKLRNTKFDLITLWHVFEHLENPKDTLVAIKKLLSKKGVLIIQVPNSESLGFKIGQKNWFHLDAPRHLQIPSRKSMEKILAKTGFKISETRNFFLDYPLDLFWSVKGSIYFLLIFLVYPIIKTSEVEHQTYSMVHKNYNGKS